jgi:hypothetical protein
LASPQRSYVAPCPGCGASVEFRSAQSAFAVCSYCRSTVVRDGATLSRIGKMAELFEDHSPLQLQVRGRWQARDFTLVGRLQYRSPDGAWTEWHALFDDGSSAWLAEDNGAYVLAFPASSTRALPQPQQLRLNARTALEGKTYLVASNEQVALVAAEGELPRLPPLAATFAMVELRSTDNEVLSLDYGSTPPALARGRPVALQELQLTGLRESASQAVQGRQFACPHCGAGVPVRLADSKAVTCPACHSLIDLRQGLAGELAHALQDEPVQPLIPLGSSGLLQGAQWQVVGFQHRMGTEPGDPDEQFGWDEYLLYNRQRGFTFLVDSSDGWSLVKPATGAPALTANRELATYLGTSYALKESYRAQTSYVAGEFYWPVERGQASFNRDYASRGKLLSMEETPREVTWSVGSTIASDAVVTAFGLQARRELLQRGDAGPTTPRGSGVGCGCGTIIAVVVVLAVLLVLVQALRGPNTGAGSGYTSAYPRSSTGGWSGGGSHK